MKVVVSSILAVPMLLLWSSTSQASETGTLFCTAKSRVTCGTSGKCVVRQDPDETISYKLGSSEFTRCFTTLSGGRRCPPDEGQLIRTGKLYPSFDILQPTIGRWYRFEYNPSGQAFFVFSYTQPSGAVTTLNGPCDVIRE